MYFSYQGLGSTIQLFVLILFMCTFAGTFSVVSIVMLLLYVYDITDTDMVWVIGALCL